MLRDAPCEAPNLRWHSVGILGLHAHLGTAERPGEGLHRLHAGEDGLGQRDVEAGALALDLILEEGDLILTWDAGSVSVCTAAWGDIRVDGMCEGRSSAVIIVVLRRTNAAARDDKVGARVGFRTLSFARTDETSPSCFSERWRLGLALAISSPR